MRVTIVTTLKKGFGGMTIKIRPLYDRSGRRNERTYTCIRKLFGDRYIIALNPGSWVFTYGSPYDLLK